jgi:hypothetical protein
MRATLVGWGARADDTGFATRRDAGCDACGVSLIFRRSVEGEHAFLRWQQWRDFWEAGSSTK